MAIYQWSNINSKVHRTLLADLANVLKEICEGAVDVVLPTLLVIFLIICIGYVIVAPLLIHGANKVASKNLTL